MAPSGVYLTTYLQNNMSILIFFILHWYLSLSMQTIFLHRYSSHKMFKLNQFWEKVFFFFTFIFQGSSFLNPRAYAIMHLNHHKYSDTINDPHSPKYSKNIFSFIYKTFDNYSKILTKEKYNYNLDLPKWDFIEKIGDLWFTRIFFSFLYLLFYINYASSFWFYLLIPIHIFMGPIHGTIVNWFGHKIGYRNYKKLKDSSKNTLIVDFFMMGELYQNNHHNNSTKINFASKWYEIDLGFLIIMILKKIKIVN